VFVDTIGVIDADKKCEPANSMFSGRACRIVASRHGAAGYKLMRRAHADTTVIDPTSF
jgi:hypothetical protein